MSYQAERNKSRKSADQHVGLHRPPGRLPEVPFRFPSGSMGRSGRRVSKINSYTNLTQQIDMGLSYRELNRKSVPDPHPIPLIPIPAMLNSSTGSAWFSVLDQGKAYRQGYLDESSQPLKDRKPTTVGDLRKVLGQ